MTGVEMIAAERKECACMNRCRKWCGLSEAIERAKSAVGSMLPEDEPDHTAAWVYRVAIEEGVKLTATAVAADRLQRLPEVTEP